jgi:C4-dicarboxylate transporter
LPVAYGFSQLAINNTQYIWTIWLTFIIAEFVSAIIASIFMKRIFDKKINTLEVK